jgi:hypothetical protein
MDSDAREWNIGCSYFRVVGAIERAGGLDGDGSRWMAIWVYLRVEDMVMVVMVMGADGGTAQGPRLHLRPYKERLVRPRSRPIRFG